MSDSLAGAAGRSKTYGRSASNRFTGWSASGGVRRIAIAKMEIRMPRASSKIKAPSFEPGFGRVSIYAALTLDCLRRLPRLGCLQKVGRDAMSPMRLIYGSDPVH
ncbi:hypothetical protein NKI59_22005 [Mesorhizobium sp. M0598]|uniref:hypothetical protein n=1 Tax=Mesorhizobium sp. M0598 TaxID=2956968 RepID=UPI003338F8A5